MVTYLVSKDCVSVLLDKIEAEDVRETVRSCLRCCGFEEWPAIEAELFRMEGRCLLIARPAGN